MTNSNCWQFPLPIYDNSFPGEFSPQTIPTQIGPGPCLSTVEVIKDGNFSRWEFSMLVCIKDGNCSGWRIQFRQLSFIQNYCIEVCKCHIEYSSCQIDFHIVANLISLVSKLSSAYIAAKFSYVPSPKSCNTEYRRIVWGNFYCRYLFRDPRK